MVKIYLIQKLIKQYQYIAILLTTSIKKIQEPCIHFLQINHLVNYWIFYQQILYFLKTSNSEFSYIEVWFTDQKYNLPEIEDKINITLVIN